MSYVVDGLISEGKRPLARPRVDGRIILGWILKKWDMRV
jgi:hypothetical protein